MKAFIVAVVAAIGIAVLAGVVLNVTGQTSGQKFASEAVRLE